MTKGSPERTIQVAIVRWLRLVLPRGSVVFAVKNEHAPSSLSARSRMAFFSKRKAEGVLGGVPDIVCALPGRTLFLETKTEVGVLSEKQQVVHEQLRAIGHPVGVVVDIDSARGFLLRCGVELREAAGQPTREVSVRKAKRLVDDDLPF